MRGLVLGGLLLLAACMPVRQDTAPAPAPAPPAAPVVETLTFRPAGFADLPGWREDRVAEALPALLKSCGRLNTATDMPWAGTAAEWQSFCTAARALRPGDDGGFRALAERELRPVAIGANGAASGLFTGYYEASLRGNRQRTGRYTVPLYAQPRDLVSVDLGQFRESLRGQRIAGRVVGSQLRPYDDRAAIDAGTLAGKADPLIWVDDAADAFFLHVQGSGRVELPDGKVVRVGYAAANGHAYTAIGRTLMQRGALTAENVSMQSIRAWLSANPAEAAKVMQSNPSYVFFREIAAGPDDGPIGAAGVPLTAGRSLAVDRTFLPLGLPLWLDATRPGDAEAAPDVTLRRLMVAQDTGGAIKGAVRGDVFWGHGAVAASVAGRMKHQGRVWLLLPTAVASRLAATM